MNILKNRSLLFPRCFFSTKNKNVLPVSRTSLFKQIVPPEKTVDRLIKLGIERKRATKEQKAQLRTSPLIQKILPGAMYRLKSVLDPKDYPRHTIPEIAFIGRSNVGKSTLINIIANSKRAIVSRTPGQTRSIDFYSIEDWFCLVDMPGYGFAYAPSILLEKWPSLIIDYLSTRRNLKRLYLLLDARHGFKVNDKEFAEKLDSHDVYFRVILTKCDLVNPDDLAKRITEVEKDLSLFRYASQKVLLSSINHDSLKNELRQEFIEMGVIPSRAIAQLRNTQREILSTKSSMPINKRPFSNSVSKRSVRS